MLSYNEIKQFQEFLLNAWPAEHYYFLNGWILRFNHGVTYRANSVIPIRYFGNLDQLENDIEIVEKAYMSYGISSTFTMHDYFEPENLDTLLKKRGYVEHDYTNALMSSIDKFSFPKNNQNLVYEIYDERIKKFSKLLAKYTQRDKFQQEVIDQIAKRIVVPKKCFIIAKKDKKVVGTVMGVLNPYGYVYVADLFVLPMYRRSGIASSLMATLIDDWAIPKGAHHVWLQVEKDNTPAMKFYSNLGMEKAYNYYYLSKEFQS
jgi:ribosomal protein S18 acetylase RimI-like enzyme